MDAGGLGGTRVDSDEAVWDEWKSEEKGKSDKRRQKATHTHKATKQVKNT